MLPFLNKRKYEYMYKITTTSPIVSKNILMYAFIPDIQ